MGLSDVLYDPLFQDLVRRHELAVRRLREAVLRLSAHYVDHVKPPEDETVGERWIAASLQNEACERLENVRESAAELLRYGFELAPCSSDPGHLAEIAAIRAAHKKRLEERTGWGERALQLRGPEEKVKVDEGPPFTIVLRPEEKSQEGP